MRAESEGPGTGAEFIVRLPLATPAAPAAAEHAHALAEMRRVLVVEDQDDGREMLVAILRMQGHEALEAASGGEALEIARRSTPDVVLLDIGLPDMDGYEVGRELRALLGRRSRLIALTGYGQPGDRARSQAAGFDEHLVKPVEPDRLAELIEGTPVAAAERR